MRDDSGNIAELVSVSPSFFPSLSLFYFSLIHFIIFITNVNVQSSIPCKRTNWTKQISISTWSSRIRGKSFVRKGNDFLPSASISKENGFQTLCRDAHSREAHESWPRGYPNGTRVTLLFFTLNPLSSKFSNSMNQLPVSLEKGGGGGECRRFSIRIVSLRKNF